MQICVLPYICEKDGNYPCLSFRVILEFNSVISTIVSLNRSFGINLFKNQIQIFFALWLSKYTPELIYFALNLATIMSKPGND